MRGPANGVKLHIILETINEGVRLTLGPLRSPINL